MSINAVIFFELQVCDIYTLTLNTNVYSCAGSRTFVIQYGKHFIAF